MSPPTNLIFAPALTITMVGNVVVVDIKGLSSDWDAYTFSLDMPSPRTKRIEPYAQPVPLENVMLEYKDPIKLEGASQNFTASKLEEPEHEASQAITPKLEESSEYSIVLEDPDCDTNP
ncbi:hypothetical protein M404DRAFT_34809 [Pisolithus tinctorius Marx 270]|uniref:Uncharacterized protein n=1 Tax=Pisolithus tinctorius Marx 270 TaxID=870435 RepID=A0A0C3NGP0_PISTI|nr:hypothetical protein M404DRAFT_34809 [Pisolithus tinctorius Marx 270]